MQNLGQIGVFAVVAEELNLSHAADRLRISKSSVSRQISALEDELKVRLFYRSVRNTRLTDEGLALYPLCREILNRYQGVLDLAEQLREQPAGRLLLAAPDAIGFHFLLPRLPEFKRQYPHINLHLQLLPTSLTHVGENMDMAVVSGVLPDSSVICRSLGEQTLRAYASPDYLTRFGEPETPLELIDHHCVITQYGNTPDCHLWSFSRGDELHQISVTASLVVNNILAAKCLVKDGAGISMLQDFAVIQEVAEGSLVPLFSDYKSPAVPIYIAYPERKHLSPKIRAMVDFLSLCFDK